MSLNSNAGTTPIWANYLDLAQDVKPWLQIPSSDTSRDTSLQLILDMACDWVQSYLGRPVAPTTFDRRYDGWSGWNGAYIELDYYPVLEITSVVEYWGVSGPHTLTESTPTNQVDGWQCEYLTGRLTRVFPGLVQKPWFPGSRNIEVVWVAGYNPVPPKIKVATLELIAHWFRNTQQESGLRPPAASAGADYDSMTAGGPFEGVPMRIMDLLEPLTQVGLG